MTRETARLVGGCGALALGFVCLDIFPPLGLLELCAAIAVLSTHRSGPALLALVPTGLILYSALLVMGSVSGWDNPIMWPLVVIGFIVASTLLYGRTTSKTSGIIYNFKEN